MGHILFFENRPSALETIGTSILFFWFSLMNPKSSQEKPDNPNKIRLRFIPT